MTDVTPRIIVENRLYKDRACTTLDHTRYEAITVTGTLRDGPGYEREPIGYLEAEPNTRISRFNDLEAFREAVEEIAEYVHIKPEAER